MAENEFESLMGDWQPADSGPIVQPAIVPVEEPKIRSPSALDERPAPAKSGSFESMMDGWAPEGFEAKDPQKEQETSLRLSMKVAADKMPDRAAEVKRYADQLGMPSDVVDRNLDAIKKSLLVEQTDYKGLINKSPKTSKWLENADHASIGKDDLDHLTKQEQFVFEESSQTKILKAIASAGVSMLRYLPGHGGYSGINRSDDPYVTKAFIAGTQKLGKGLSQLPALGYTAAQSLPMTGKLIRALSDQKTPGVVYPPEWLLNNPVTKFYDKREQEYHVPEIDIDTWGAIKAGDLDTAGKALAAQLANTAPSMALLLAGGILGKANQALTAVAATTAAESVGEAKSKGVTPVVGIASSALKGYTEAAFEKVGTLGLLEHWAGAITEKVGRDSLKKILASMSKTLAYSVLGEGFEEASTSVSQDLIDYTSGINPDALNGIWNRAINSGLVGGLSGGVMTGPTAAAVGFSRGIKVRQSEQQLRFFDGLMQAAKESKTRERSPESHTAFIENALDATPMETAYITAENLETFFQSRNLNPEETLKTLGVESDLLKAKETGELIEIKTARLVNAFAGTENEKAIREFVSFDPEMPSVTEQKQTEEDAKLELEEEFKKLELVKDNPSAVAIAKEIESRLLASPPMDMLPKDEETWKAQVKGEAELWGRVSVIEADKRTKSGVPTTAEEYFESIKPQIIGGGVSGDVPSSALLQAMRAGETETDRSSFKTTSVDVVTPSVHTPLRGEDFTKAAHTPGDFTNKDTGQVIRVNADTARKAASFATTVVKRNEGRTKARQHMEILQHVGEVAKNAVLISESQDSKDRPGKWNYYFGEISVAGKRHLVKLEVNDKGVLHNYVVVDPRGVAPEALATSQSPRAGENQPLHPRESYSIDEFKNLVNAARNKFVYFQAGKIISGSADTENKIIRLFKSSDASTFLHESAHIWLEDRFSFVRANKEKLTEEYLGDWNILSKYLGLSEDQARITKAQQEKFAESFEVYLRKGEAPALSLRNIFKKLKRWLTEIHKRVGMYSLQISPEVQGVFDRMIATDQEIAEAKLAISEPIEVAGLNPDDAKKISRLQEQARDRAIEILLAQQMKEIKKSHRKFVEAKEQELKAEIRDRILKTKIYAAQEKLIERLKTKKPAKQIANEYIKGKLSESVRTQFEIFADLEGYDSASEMANAMSKAIPLSEAVSEQLQVEMRPYADIKNTEAIKIEALKAIHRDSNLELMALEAKILEDLSRTSEVKEEAKRRRAQESKLEAKVIKARAKELIWSQVQKKATRFTVFFTAQKNAAVKVARAVRSGKFLDAAKYKRQQLLNHALAKESIRAAKKFESWKRYLDKVRKLQKEKFKKEEHFNQVGSLLSKLGFQHKDFDPKSRSETLEQWALRMTEETNAVNIAPWLFNEDRIGTIDSMSMAEIGDVINAIKNIVSVESLENRAFKIADGVALSEIINELEAETKEGMQGRQSKKKSFSKGKWDKTRQSVAKYFNSLRKTRTILVALGGYKDFNKWIQYFLKPVKEAADRESVRLREVNSKLEELFKTFSDEELKSLQDNYYIPELGTSGSKLQLITFALNMGTEGNFDKLASTRPIGIESAVEWNRDVIQKTIENHLTKKDLAFVQGVWNVINSQWNDISSLHKRVTGFSPGKVEARPFSLMLKSGETVSMDGGYYPLAKDPRGSNAAQAEEDLSSPLHTEQNPAWTAATVTGFTKARTNAAYAVSTDHRTIFKHLRDVIHDIEFREVVIDLRRLIQNEKVRSLVEEVEGEEAYAILKNWVKSVANGDLLTDRPPHPIENWIAALRKRTSAAFLMFRVGVLTQNLSNIFLYSGAVDGFTRKSVTRAIFNYGLTYWGGLPTGEAKNIREAVFAKSAFMYDKHNRPDHSFAELSNKYFGSHSKVAELAGHVMAFTDELTSVPMWMEAYHMKFEETGDEALSVQYADALIENSLGSSRRYDLPDIKRNGNELTKTLTMFFDFMNTQFNRWETEYGKGFIRSDGDKMRFLGFVGAQLLLFNSISLLLSGKGPEDDDKEDWVKWYLKESLSYPLAFLPLVREGTDLVLDKAFGMKGFGYRLTPATAIFEATGRATDTFRGWVDDKRDGIQVVESLSKVAAIAYPYPDQFNAWFFNAYDMVFSNMTPKQSDLMTRRPRAER